MGSAPVLSAPVQSIAQRFFGQEKQSFWFPLLFIGSWWFYWYFTLFCHSNAQKKEILGKPNTIGGDMQYVFLHSQLACTHMSFPDWQFSCYAFHWKRIGKVKPKFTYVKSCQATFGLASPDRICTVANLLFSWSWRIQTILKSPTKQRNIANKLAELSADL